MTLSSHAKAIASAVVMLIVVGLQAVLGVYDNGIDGIEWLGVLATVVGPAGLVAAVANTNYSPATKAVVQSLSAGVVLVVQGIIGVYDGGISTEEWITIAILVASILPVYVVENAGRAAVATRRA